MTALEIEIRHDFGEHSYLKNFTYEFENDNAALLAAAAFAVEEKITKCITYKVKENER